MREWIISFAFLFLYLLLLLSVIFRAWRNFEEKTSGQRFTFHIADMWVGIVCLIPTQLCVVALIKWDQTTEFLYPETDMMVIKPDFTFIAVPLTVAIAVSQVGGIFWGRLKALEIEGANCSFGSSALDMLLGAFLGFICPIIYLVVVFMLLSRF